MAKLTPRRVSFVMLGCIYSCESLIREATSELDTDVNLHSKFASALLAAVADLLDATRKIWNTRNELFL